MKRKNAMSAIGYAIVTVILIAFGMIISAPMITEKYQSNNRAVEKTYNNNSNYNNNYDVRSLEDRINSLSSRIDSLSSKSVSDKYVCSIEGGLNEDGVVVPIDPNNPPAKFIFSCEYRK